MTVSRAEQRSVPPVQDVPGWPRGIVQPELRCSCREMVAIDASTADVPQTGGVSCARYPEPGSAGKRANTVTYAVPTVAQHADDSALHTAESLGVTLPTTTGNHRVLRFGSGRIDPAARIARRNWTA